MSDDTREEELMEAAVDARGMSAWESVKVSLDGWRTMVGLPSFEATMIDALTIGAGVFTYHYFHNEYAPLAAGALVLIGVIGIAEKIVRRTV